ncbi:MAG: hypothetical protein AAGC43_04980 [Bacteroidota bacterium]
MWRLEFYLSLTFSFCCCLTSLVLGQEDLITIDSKDKNFVSIHLQAHKELPRFGVLDNYVSEDSKPTRTSYTSEIREKIKKVRKGLVNYSLMTRLKYLAPLMNDLDTERLTAMSGTADKIQRNSALIQNFIRRGFASSICLSEVCQNLGREKNEFERLRNYKAFTYEHLESLQLWAETFFEEDQLEGYHVSTISFGRQYDFERKGYWVRHSFGMNNAISVGNNRLIRILFEPKTLYESNLKNKFGRGSTLQFLFKMDEATAERYQMKGITRLYLVKKIKIQHGGKIIEDATQPIEFSYAHVNPEFELYEDIALTKLLQTLSLDNLTLKNP